MLHRETLEATGLAHASVDDYCWRAQKGHQHSRALDQELTAAAGSLAVTANDNATNALEGAALQLLAALKVAAAGKRGSRPCKDGERSTARELGAAAATIEQGWRINTPPFPLPEEIRAAARRHYLFLAGASVQSAPVATPYGAFTAFLARASESTVWFVELITGQCGTRVAKTDAYLGIGVLSPRSVSIAAHPLFSGDRFWGIEAFVTVNRKDVCERYVVDFHRDGAEWLAGELFRVDHRPHDPVWVPFPAISDSYIRQGDLVFSKNAYPPAETPPPPSSGASPWGLVFDRDTAHWHRIGEDDVLHVTAEEPITITSHGVPDVALAPGYWFVKRGLHSVSPRS